MSNHEQGQQGIQGIQGPQGVQGCLGVMTPCVEHSGVISKIDGINETLTGLREDIRKLFDEAYRRWPVGAIVALTTMGTILGAVIGAFGMYVKLGGS